MTEITDLVPLKLVADANTPAGLQQYNNVVIGIPPGVVIPPIGVVFGIAGIRNGPAGAFTWLMTGPIDVVAVFVDGIPGAGGWKSQAARQVYINAINALIGFGITPDTIAAGIPSLYSAAVTNHTTP